MAIGPNVPDGGLDPRLGLKEVADSISPQRNPDDWVFLDQNCKKIDAGLSSAGQYAENLGDKNIMGLVQQAKLELKVAVSNGATSHELMITMRELMEAMSGDGDNLAVA